MKKRSLGNQILIAVLCGIVFLLLTMPFRDIFSVFTVTEVRPAAVLNPFLGISFGVPAGIGIAVANMIADGISGYPVNVLILGLPLQFIYCILPYMLWKYFTKGEEHKYRLDSVIRVLKFTAAVLSFAVVSGIGVGFIVLFNYGANFWETAFFVFLNNFTMSMVFGCPLMIIANQIISRQKGNDRKITRNEWIIIFTAIAETIAIIAVIAVMYAVNPGNEIYEKWNTIFLVSTFIVNVLMLISLFIMLADEKKNSK